MENLKALLKEQLSFIWHNIKTMSADELSIKSVGLSALLLDIGEEVIKREQSFAQVQLKIWEESGEITGKEVEIKAKITPEFKELREWQTLEKSVKEFIMASKKRLQFLGDKNKRYN